MDEEHITLLLDKALLSDEEYNNPDSWKDFTDPFPTWI